MSVDVVELTRKILLENRYLSLATTDNNGNVWATPLSFALDENYNFYFTTAIDSTHIEHIKRNPKVSFSIYNSTVRVSDIDGLQIKGLVVAVDKDELDKVVSMYYSQVFPDEEERKEWEAEPEFFTKDDYPIYRFFQIVPEEIYKRDSENTEIDRRIQVSITQLRKIPAKYPTLKES